MTEGRCHLMFSKGMAVVVTEWGGKAQGDDAVWHQRFAEYLVRQCLSDTFYWALNPNSGETGGLFLDDWLTVREYGRLALIVLFRPARALTSGTSWPSCARFSRRPQDFWRCDALYPITNLSD